MVTWSILEPTSTPPTSTPVDVVSASGQATSAQTTELLLQQLMSEMKCLRESVDTFPTGPMQGVAATLQTSNEIQEPSSKSPSSAEEMEVDEQTVFPSIPQVAVPVQALETSTASANLQVSEWRTFVRSSGNMFHLRFAPSAGEPLLEPAQIYVIWCTGSAKAGIPSSFS
jgi:hypothetical protein